MIHDEDPQLLVGIACDADLFFRQQCPRCGLDFKLKGSPSAQQDVLSWWVEHANEGSPVQAGEGEGTPRSDKIHCPYCSASEPKQRFAHPEVVAYVRRIARREIIAPMLSNFLRDLTAGARASKFVSWTVSEEGIRSPRPISGPEANDQVVIMCLACKRPFKVDEHWRGTVRCVSCSEELVPQ